MQFWNTAGMGTLSGMFTNASQGLSSRARLDALGARIGVGNYAEPESPFEGSAFLGKGPQFPGSALDRLRGLMFANMQEREGMMNEFQQKLSSMKNEFFESHSYETVMGQDGKPHVQLDGQGKPTVVNGKETQLHQEAREEYETNAKETLKEAHTNEKETFLKEEKQQIMNFLQENKHDLGNPAVQNELQKMILLTQKKALKLKQDQEEAVWKVDLPTEDMKLLADDETRKIREQEKKHQDVEDASQDAKELIMYQEEVNRQLKEEKDKLFSKERDEAFLRGPEAYLKPPPPPPLSSVLPPYLTEALYNMGIYSLD